MAQKLKNHVSQPAAQNKQLIGSTVTVLIIESLNLPTRDQTGSPTLYLGMTCGKSHEWERDLSISEWIIGISTVCPARVLGLYY